VSTLPLEGDKPNSKWYDPPKMHSEF
jgi:hypothetical protein